MYCSCMPYSCPYAWLYACKGQRVSVREQYFCAVFLHWSLHWSAASENCRMCMYNVSSGQVADMTCM